MTTCTTAVLEPNTMACFGSQLILPLYGHIVNKAAFQPGMMYVAGWLTSCCAARYSTPAVDSMRYTSTACVHSVAASTWTIWLVDIPHIPYISCLCLL